MRIKNGYSGYENLNIDEPQTGYKNPPIHGKKKDHKVNSESSRFKMEIKSKLQYNMERLARMVDDGIAAGPKEIKNDHVIQELEEMLEEVKVQNFEDLGKNIIEILGHRIIQLELEQRKIEIEKKRIKKEEIEQSFFRHKKIKKFDYDELSQQKIHQNSYIVRPYSTGKCFVQSDIYYRQLDDFHTSRLQQCEYLQTIKKVNSIYMQNYSHFSAQSGKTFQNGLYINLALFFCLLLAVLSVLIVWKNYDYIEYIIGANVVIIALIASSNAIKSYRHRPNTNNQLEQTKCDVKLLFQNMNLANKLKGRAFEWICPDDFMYLEVHFEQ